MKMLHYVALQAKKKKKQLLKSHILIVDQANSARKKLIFRLFPTIYSVSSFSHAFFSYLLILHFSCKKLGNVIKVLI